MKGMVTKMLIVTILLTIFVFGILIFIHELGHFAAARLAKVDVKEFAIGMGPKIFKKKSKKSGTLYSVRAFPIGGFCSMVGEDEDSDESGSFTKKSIPKRTAIILAGPLLNVLLGFILMFFIVFFGSTLVSTTIGEFNQDAISSQHLQLGDKILKINKTSVHSGNEVLYEITMSGDKPIDILVERNGEKVLLEDVIFPQTEEQGIVMGELDFKLFRQERTFTNLMKQTFTRSLSMVKMVYDGLWGMISGRFGMEAVSGPVGISSAVGQAASGGIFSVLMLMSMISINLGIFNMLPFPALDGGRFVFLMVEAIRRKPINRDFEAYVNMFGFLLLIALSIFITFKDIFKLIG